MSFLTSSRPDKSLVAELERRLARRIDVLASGSGPEASVLATRELLALRRLGQWSTWGWDEILNARWRAEGATFVWTTTGGRTVEVELESAGRLPELFRERVQASTVVTETHELTRGTVQIIGRRCLDGSDAMTWYATASGGADLNDEATAAFVVGRTDELKSDWS